MSANTEMYNKQNYNTNTSHPIIANSQEYIYYKKYISIHSEDRDYLRYPNSSEFEIELPEDYINVSTLKLVQWTFPANYNTFSASNGNVTMAFKLNNPYNPTEFDEPDVYQFRIFEALFNSDQTYYFDIEEGFYNPSQMAIELTNKFNYVVSVRIIDYFEKQNKTYPNDGWDNTLSQFVSNGGYARFIIVYNNVSLKLWFGNKADGFLIINELGELTTNLYTTSLCISSKGKNPDYSSYGLPGYIGFPRYNEQSISTFATDANANKATINGKELPRFYYGNVTPGDDGYWLTPLDLSGCKVHWIEAKYKLNIMGEAFMYMELSGQNCIDETRPYNVSKFTTETNQTNGTPNAAFAKMAIPSTPLAQWFDRDSIPYKLYHPPAERIRRLKIKLRYHNGQLVNFGVFNYSFMLEFTLLVPQILRTPGSLAMAR